MSRDVLPFSRSSAYRFVTQAERSSEGGWHRCLEQRVPGSLEEGTRRVPVTVSVSNLPEGTYWIEITDDFSMLWLVETYGLYNVQAGKCGEPQYPGFGPISYDSLTVAAPHTEEPGKPAQPPPEGPMTTAPSPTVPGPNSPTGSPPQSTPLRCRAGYARARISGQATCLHQGESCSWRNRHHYRRYHFACVRKGKHYRLVRRR
jgi:hypothetical protein